VKSTLQALIPHKLQLRLVPAYHSINRRFAHFDRMVDRRTLSLKEFEQLLHDLGINKGAVVLIHSSMDAISRRVPSLSAIELIRLLQNILTEQGTLLMPTFPFTGKQSHYIDRIDRFDVRRTPSQVGLITEVFRRMPGVTRSLHPTHSVAAWGYHADRLLNTHHLGGAFGKTSPIYKLREFGGRVVGLGTGLRDSFTILHVPEEIHPAARSRFFDDRHKIIRISNGDADLEYAVQPLRPDVHRSYDRVERVLLREGILHYVSMRGLRCSVTEAEPFIERCMRLVDEDQYL
jgi:aminoglycoside 3-N-acetyltransferase